MSHRRKQCARPGPGVAPGLEALEDRLVPASGVGSGPAVTVPAVAVHTGSSSSTDILVQFRAGTTPAALARTTLGPQLGLVAGLYEVQLSAGTTVAQALAEYKADTRVLTAEPDYQLSAAQAANDSYFSLQWALHNTGQEGGKPGADIHALLGWNVTSSSPGVVVALMDTGIDYNHPDLYLNIWINQAEIPRSRLKNLVDVDHDGHISFRDLNNPINQGPGKITDVNRDGRIDAADILAPMVRDSRGNDTGQGGWAFPGNTQDGDTAHPNDFIGWDTLDNNNNPSDQNGHGTHVAGTLGAIGNNGLGVAGVDWNVQMMPVKFLNADGTGTISAFIQGLNYAVTHGARISNNSWEGASPSTALNQAIANARAHGQIFVAAAGNEGTNNDTTPTYPANFAFDNVVSVAATDNRDNLASFSNFGGKTVTLAAPGVDVISTLPGGNYGMMSGTSMAAPLVTGALALVWGQHPTWTYTQVISQVLRTVDKFPSLTGKVASGGRLDLAAALGSSVVSPVGPHVVSATFGGPSAGTLSTVTLTFDHAVDPATFAPSNVTLTGPGGKVVTATSVTAVAGSGNKVFHVAFAPQTTAGTWVLKVGTGARDLTGNAMLAYQATYTLAGVSTFSGPGATVIPARGRVVSLLTVNQDVPIASLAVRVNITYPKDSDLVIHIQAPDGKDYVLAKNVGGTGQNFSNTLFSDQAPTALANGTAPFAGSFKPQAPLAGLKGTNARGTWKLWVENLNGPFKGTLNSWSLVIRLA
jgi:subtilisin family serine protease